MLNIHLFRKRKSTVEEKGKEEEKIERRRRRIAKRRLKKDMYMFFSVRIKNFSSIKYYKNDSKIQIVVEYIYIHTSS